MSSGIFLLFSIGILGGILSSTLLKKVRVPQVLGYLLAGLIIGQSGFKLIRLEDIQKFHSFSIFALAIIGLLVGAEIKLSDFRRYGKQFLLILLGEGMGAFFLVTILCSAVLYYVTGQWVISIAGGIIFGAISSATDPASTMSVLWEKKSAGILTRTITAVIALDDCLALVLYGFASGAAQIMAAHSGVSISHEIVVVVLEIFGSVAVGVIFGMISCWILNHIDSRERAITTIFGLFLMSIALSNRLHLDVIITALSIGIYISNRAPHASKQFFEFIHALSSPVYVLFFVFTGARMTLGSMPAWMWIVVAVFVLGRSAGKVTGAYLGATLSKSAESVKKYTGLGLFSQGGVAIGLAVVAGNHLNNIPLTDGVSLGDAIITGVTATTFLIQIIGPATVSLATILSGEAGLRISLIDLLETTKVSEVMPEKPPVLLTEKNTVSDAIEQFSFTDASFLPVVNSKMQLQGVVTFESIRQILSEAPFWKWSLVIDIMDFDSVKVSPEDTMKMAYDLSYSRGLFNIPVVKDDVLVSVLNVKKAENHLKRELLSRQDAANG